MSKKSNDSRDRGGRATQGAVAEMAKVAVLDEDGVYQGMQDIPLSALTPDHVHLPDGCDLPPGRYWWDAKNKTFMPNPKGDR